MKNRIRFFINLAIFFIVLSCTMKNSMQKYGKEKKENNLLKNFGFLILSCFLISGFISGVEGCANTCSKYGMADNNDEHAIKLTSISDINAAPGETASVPVTVKNTGDFDERDIEIYISNLPDGWISKTLKIDRLLAHESKTAMLEINVPKNASLEKYGLKAEVENSKDSDYEKFTLIVEYECTKDTECKNTQFCENNRCENKKNLGEKCKGDNECTSDLCNDFCAECKTDTNCFGNTECTNGSCVEKKQAVEQEKIEDVKTSMNAARSAIINTSNAIDKATGNGMDTENSEIKLFEAKDKLEEADNSFNARDYENAIKDARSAKLLADEARKIADESEKKTMPLEFLAPEEVKTGEDTIIKVTSNKESVEGAEIIIKGTNYSYKTDINGEIKFKLDKEGANLIEINKEGYESESFVLNVKKESGVAKSNIEKSVITFQKNEDGETNERNYSWLWALIVLPVIGVISLFVIKIVRN